MKDNIHIIACSVFKDAITYLADWIADRPFTFSFLPSNLHLRPQELKKELMGSIQATKTTNPCVGCLYGQCFENIDQSLSAGKVLRIPCHHCYEILLGSPRYHSIIEKEAGTFFVEKELLIDFDQLCRIPLELDDPEIRDLYFRHYQQLVYIRQPLDPDLSDHARYVASLLNLNLNVEEADYDQLKDYFNELQAISK